MHKVWLSFLTMVLALTFCGCQTQQGESDGAEETLETPLTEVTSSENIYGIWFSYRDYQRQCTDMDEEAFRSYCDQAIANMKSLGINTLYLHAVAFTDALYDSKIYPRSTCVSSDYDPFLIFSSKAKEAGMHVEAWINPMRSVLVEEAETLPENSIIKQWIDENNERVRQVGNRYYLNVAYTEVRELILSVVQELLDQYDIDGIHMDDYFYPYDTETNFDALVYSKAQKGNEDLTLEDFRIDNVNQLVKEIYQTVKAKDASLWFGISPAGNLDNCIHQLYGNPVDWVELGIVDYVEPQIYWGYQHPSKPYLETLKEWKEVLGDSVLVMPGLAAYSIGESYELGEEEANQEWILNSDLMARQTKDALDNGCQGAIYFSYTSFFYPTESTLSQVQTEIENLAEVIQNNP